MNFLAPWALWLGTIAAIPLALHLWRRRQATRVEFPAVRYLRRVVRDHAREVRAQNLLLLVIRLAIVAALALAAARPFAAVPGIGHPPTALVLVLDNSLSSQAVTRDGPMLDRLRRLADGLLDAASNEDRLWLVSMDGTVSGGDRAAVRAAVDRLPALDAAGDAATAWRRAHALLADRGSARGQVVVLTDGQRASWDLAFPRDSAVRSVVVMPERERRPNHAIIEAVADPQVWGAIGGIRFVTRGADSVPWRAVVEGRTVARGTARDGVPVSVRVRPITAGWGTAVIEVEPDELRGDDRRFLAFRAGALPSVMVDPSAGPFVARAFEALVESGRATRGPAVLVSSAPRRGVPTLVLPPRDPIALPESNRALAQAGIPWAFGAPRRSPASLDVEGATTRLWYPLVARGEVPVVDTLARVGQAPWAIRGAGYVLVASPLDPEATDLPLRAGFVPWLERLVTQQLTSGDLGVIETAPGATLDVPFGVDAVERADGAVVPVVSGRTWTAPPQAGVHFWRRGGARVGAVVGNPEPGESDSTSLRGSDLARRLAAISLPADPATLATAVFAADGPRPIDAALLVLVLLLCLAEGLLARRRTPATADLPTD